MTPLLTADSITQAFNATTDRNNWKARVGGTNSVPLVKFVSKTSMVELTYYVLSGKFAIHYTKVSCAFGDFTASAYSALSQVLLALKASGHDVQAPLDARDGVLRLEFDPTTKQTHVHLAKLEDDWIDSQEDSFKGPEINL